MAHIEFVNHSSFIVSGGNVRLMCDPWLEGPVFDDGWDLLSATRFSYDDFRDITHIWFSHEHPDHFNPPNLRKIPKDCLARITVLYQGTRDHRVSEFCKKLGFGRVIEMNPDSWIGLGEEIEVRCAPHDNGDSWLAVRTPEFCLLNLNDCVVTSARECREIAAQVGPVDVLATQFSYANRVANPGDLRGMARAAEQKLSWVRTQVRTLRPTYVIPFASFSYFSHEDNWYLNAGMNRVDKAVTLIRDETDSTPVVLYPADRWDPADTGAHDSSRAIECYLRDYERALGRGPVRASGGIPMETLLEHGARFASQLRARNGLLTQLLPPAYIFVEDHDRALRLSARGLEPTSRDRDRCDLQCKSDVLDHAFVLEWGGRTLDINGRFRVPSGGRYWKFKIYSTLSSFNSRGEGFPSAVATSCQRLLTWMRFNLTFRGRNPA